MLNKTVVNDNKQTYRIDQSSNHKIQTDILETPRVINVVDSEMLADQSIFNLNDALRNVSGVSTFGGGEGGGGNITTNDKVTIRGFNANGNIYIDGIRDVAGYSRDLFNVEQVEVTKGASSSLSGKGTSGGAVNMVTKRAQMANFGQLVTSYDQGNTLRIATNYNTQLNDTIAVRINAVHSSGGDLFDNGVEEYETRAIAPSVTAQISEQTSVSLDAVIMNQDNLPMLGLPYVTEAVAAQTELPEGPLASHLWSDYYGVAGRDMEEVDVNTITLAVDHRFNDSLHLRNQLRFGKNEKKSVLSRPLFRNQGDRSNPVYNGDVSIDWTQNLDEKTELVVNQTDFIIDFTTGSVDHDLVAGVEVYREDKTSQRLTNNIALDSGYVQLGNPRPHTGFTGSVDIDGLPSITESKGLAFYALDTFSINDTWLFTAGVRHEDFNASGARYMWRRENGQWVREYADGLQSDASFTSWNLSAGYKINDNGFLYVSAANSQDPAAGNLAFTWSQENVERFAELGPEEADNLEFGAKFDLLDKRLQVAGAYFVTTKTVLDRDDSREYFLSGEQQSKGVELSANGQFNDHLSVFATFTALDTEITQDFSTDSLGDGLSAAPDRAINLWLNYNSNAWFMGAGINHSSGNTFWRRSRPYFETGTVTLLQLMGGYRFNEQLALQVNIDNLTDKEYVTDFSARGHFRPGDPRNVQASLNYKF